MKSSIREASSTAVTGLRVSRAAMFAAVAVVGVALFHGGNAMAGEVSVTLSDGSTLEMEEPTDMLGMTWEDARQHLPRILLTVDGDADSTSEKLGQLLSTAGSIGHLYVQRYDQTVGYAEDGGDLTKIEDSLTRIREGKGKPGSKEAVEQGEAVVFWTAMLEDNAAKLKIKAPTRAAPNTSKTFIDLYAGMVESGESPGIYSEAIRQAARDNPSAVNSYLKSATPERVNLITRITAGTPEQLDPRAR